MPESVAQDDGKKPKEGSLPRRAGGHSVRVKVDLLDGSSMDLEVEVRTTAEFLILYIFYDQGFDTMVTPHQTTSGKTVRFNHTLDRIQCGKSVNKFI